MSSLEVLLKIVYIELSVYTDLNRSFKKTDQLYQSGLGPGGVTPNDDLQRCTVAYHIGLVKNNKMA